MLLGLPRASGLRLIGAALCTVSRSNSSIIHSAEGLKGFPQQIVSKQARLRSAGGKPRHGSAGPVRQLERASLCHPVLWKSRSEGRAAARPAGVFPNRASSHESYEYVGNRWSMICQSCGGVPRAYASVTLTPPTLLRPTFKLGRLKGCNKLNLEATHSPPPDAC